MLGNLLLVAIGIVIGAGLLAVFGKNNTKFVESFRVGIIKAYHGLLRLLGNLKAKLTKKKDDG